MIVHEWAFGRNHDRRTITRRAVTRYDEVERFELDLRSAPLESPLLAGYVDTDAIGVPHPPAR